MTEISSNFVVVSDMIEHKVWVQCVFDPDYREWYHLPSLNNKAIKKSPKTIWSQHPNDKTACQSFKQNPSYTLKIGMLVENGDFILRFKNSLWSPGTTNCSSVQVQITYFLNQNGNCILNHLKFFRMYLWQGWKFRTSKGCTRLKDIQHLENYKGANDENYVFQVSSEFKHSKQQEYVVFCKELW